MNLKRIIRKSKACYKIFTGGALPSFSQVGEDMVINYLLRSINIAKPTYLDIGANHPIHGSNTYFFYHRGFSGICVEPDPNLASLISRVRPRDKVLNVGIGLDENKSGLLHIFPDPYSGWNTFSKSEAENRENQSNIKVKEVREIEMIPINNVLSNYFEKTPNFLSLDVEGLDEQILKSMDFEKFRPEVVCIETITFSVTNQEEKLHTIIDFMNSKGYKVYADTHVNTIFSRGDIL